ncbi:hypothetical protein Gotur_026384 [Gossypium turneri]
MALLRCSKFQVDRVYSRAVNVPTFSKKLMNVTGMSEQLERCNPHTPRYQEKVRCFCSKYIWLGCLP